MILGMLDFEDEGKHYKCRL